MSEPILLPEELVSDAKLKANAAQRTLPEQIEFWAILGRAIESQLGPEQTVAKALSECLAEVETPAGRERLKQYLATLPYPHYEALPEAGFFARIDADGKCTVGRFVGRRFEEKQNAAGTP